MDDLILQNPHARELGSAFLALFIILFVVLLVLYILHLKNRIKTFEKPRYGFLGKNIYAFFCLLTLGGVVIFASYGIMSPRLDDSRADFEIEGRVDMHVQSQTLVSATIDLKFVPVISGIEWGNSEQVFDIYWELTGKDFHKEIELQKSQLNPGGFTVTLSKGVYNVKILVVHNGETYNYTDRLTI